MKSSKQIPTAKRISIAELRLALLKENFQFLDFVEVLTKAPYEICPEFRLAAEDYQAYIMRTDLMAIREEPFFGGIDKKLPFDINPSFIRETQLNSIPVEEILTLLSPAKNLEDLSSIQLQRMLPRLFHKDAVVEYGLAPNLISHDRAPEDRNNIKVNNLRYRSQVNLDLHHHERLLKIDLSRPRADMIDQFTEIIDHAIETQKDVQNLDLRLQAEWATTSIEECPYMFAKPWDIYNSRIRQETWEQLEVWKLRKTRMSFPLIAKQMNKDIDWVKTSFYRVFQKIQGVPYSPKKIVQIREIRKVELNKTCETCPTYATCIDPCPEILHFIEQDVVSSMREKTHDHEILDLLASRAHQPTDLD
ncbi:hypothetical protein P9J64_00555 [Deltaproteobacteria bacterium IMCC39524]|nr:hypothetical protein [Deltaproteobacteria bacterium IMCC39524]